MSKASNVEQLFHRIHLFLVEGQADMALATLAQISTSDANQEYEVAYLRAWCATLRGNWDTVAALLSSADSLGHEGVDLPSLGQTERRRRVYYLLLLGQAANYLGYFEEATRHYTQCIKFLDERRMNILSVRIKARCGLGRAYTQIGFYAVALAHYENALQLCRTDERTCPDLLEIHAGLCTVHRCLGHVEQALIYGQQALQWCQERSNDARSLGPIHNLLGQVFFQKHAFEEATFHYTEALELAKRINSLELILTNLTALASVRLEEGLLEEARCLYEQGLVYQTGVSDARLVGALY
ncbi:MAG: tetratricopeptide repeat protein, partial [Ktedonobacteraceae bacterium]